MLDPIEALQEAMVHKLIVTVLTNHGGLTVGHVLHISNRTVWMVVGNEDVFIPLIDIDAVDTIYAS